MSRSRYAVAVLLYASLIVYASTIIGVAGPNYVPIPWSEALMHFIHMPFVAHGSTQRSDWMGNLILMVPLGFLMAGWFQPGRGLSEHDDRRSSVPAAIAALILCGGFILAVKYAQIFFPPRTVTLNYVIAQGLGAGMGIVLFSVLRSPLAHLSVGAGRLEGLRVALWIYAGLLIVFMLMPLDFALNAEDVAAQAERIPDTFTALGDESRPLSVRLAMLLASCLATAPIGALLTLTEHGRLYVGRSTGTVAWIGFVAMLGVYALSLMVLSASPSLPAVAVRTLGIAFGAWCMHALVRQDPTQLRYLLGDLVPWAAPAFLLILLAVNGLLSLDWNPPGATAGDYGYMMLPLYNYYIVSKAQAAKSIMAHVVMYAPLGIMVWLRAKHGGAAIAGILGVVLCAMVEGARSLRPGLVPDINAVPLAGISGWAAASLMTPLWRMVASVAIGRKDPTLLSSRGEFPGTQSQGRASTPLNWRDRAALQRARRRSPDPIGPVTGDVEDY